MTTLLSKIWDLKQRQCKGESLNWLFEVNENVVNLKVLALQQLAVVVGVALLVTFISSSSCLLSSSKSFIDWWLFLKKIFFWFYLLAHHSMKMIIIIIHRLVAVFKENLLLILLAGTSFHDNNNNHHLQVGGCFMLMIGLELGFGSFTFWLIFTLIVISYLWPWCCYHIYIYPG